MSKFRQHPTLPQGFSDTFDERFWRRVNKDGPVPSHWPELGPCWLWTGGIFGHGYGEISRGPRTVRPVHIGAHIASWIIHFGLVPEGLRVLHKCDNRPCCNPDHLFVGTQMDNFMDMFKKGRYVRATYGELNRHAKLTDSEVLEIRKQFVGGWDQIRSLARKFGVAPTTLYAVVAGQSWKHLQSLAM